MIATDSSFTRMAFTISNLLLAMLPKDGSQSNPLESDPQLPRTRGSSICVTALLTVIEVSRTEICASTSGLCSISRLTKNVLDSTVVTA
jgi:hypothetical protein